MTILRTELVSMASTRKGGPKLIEMVGVAGSGKSTLLMALGGRNGTVEPFPLPGKLRYLPALARIFLIWLPIQLAKYRRGRWFTLDEIRNIGYLETWLSYIRSRAASEDIVVVLDPGSVYWLSALKEFGPPFTGDRVFQRWWKQKLDQWGAALDVIVWLEAPHELLLERVLSRDEWHGAKFQSQKEALEEFERLDTAYEKLIAELTRSSKIKLFHYSTDRVSVDCMAGEIQSSLDLGKRTMSLSFSITQKLSGNA